MSKKLQVLLDDLEYEMIQAVAKSRGMTVSEWVRQVLRKALHVDPNSTKKRASPEEKLRAIAKAYRHQHPTADIEVMLAEIEAGRNLQ